MSPSSALPPPTSSQPQTPYQPQPDSSTSPSISNNPPPQPPPGPSMPTYASLNATPYNSPGPSSYAQHLPNNQYMYQPQGYYPHQPPRHLPNNGPSPYNSTTPQYANRYPEQPYSQQPHYQPMYQQHLYGGYPGIPMNGGGGPGPATMQNGYGGGGYHPESYQPMPYGVYPQQPHYPVPQDQYQQFSNLSHPSTNGNTEEGDPMQQIPPPPFPSQDQQSMNGHAPPTHQPFRPSYPPNHPYAYGVGVGYPGYQPQPHQGNYSGYGGYQESGYPAHPALPNGNGMRNVSKGLNPAAAGFSFTPSSASGSRANSQPSSTPVINGAIIPSSFQSNAQIPSTDPAKNDEPLPDIPKENGHTIEITQNGTANRVDADVSSSTRTEGKSEDYADNAVDIEQPEKSETPNTSTAPSSDPNVSITTDANTASTAATTVSSPKSTSTPKPVESAVEPITSSTSIPDQSSWNFVGETLVGLTSPIQGSSSRQVSGPPSSATSVTTGSRKRSTITPVAVGPLRLAAARPDHTSEASNSYAANLAKIIPSAVKTETINVHNTKRIVRRSKGSKEATKRTAIFALGDQKKRTTSPRASDGAKKLAFGEIDASEFINLAPSVQVHAPTILTATATTADSQTSAPSSEISTPIVKAKPASWAALVGGSSRAPSVSSSSKVPSPAKSTASLPITENEAGPSRLPSSEPTSTTDNVVSSPSPAPAPEKKKAPFNYAAAAASGASMTPQEELAKLLSEGVKGKAKENTQATLPRGLINTGNMCFANTILQVLVYCPPFTELFEELGKRLKADLARKTPLLEAMIIFLREFNAPFPPPSAPIPNGSNASGTSTPKGKGKDARREAFIPENVYDAMKENKRFDSMRRGHQEDAEEYLGFFLNTLHEELLYVLSRTQPTSRNVSKSSSMPNGDAEHRIERPVSPGAGDDSGWLEVGKKQKTHVVRATESKESAITRLFGGTIRSLLKTPGNKDSVTIEPYQPLQLDIQSLAVKSIEDALRHLTEPEVVNGVWSAQRKAEVEATKQIFIETFPQCWILHLKRFVYDGTTYNVVKKNKGIAYGQELIVPPEIVSPGRRSAGAIKYKLFGVVYHHGTSASGGHYTVAVSRQDGGGWIHFDDENVTNIPKEDVIISKEEAESGKIGLIGGRERTAYLLFYQRVTVR
ncbi:uncharacterized protein I303_100677 [Kwoniella dejecticola CBS 10117]|uniref:ubiquitinyl hydrolase 1 n=1 Tax=Kwoniella dejecticola CBS 10117 TaxID=1296121 RepID=A0A1A6AFN6_9TREE|nr:uncharacterized protein I303_00681 [Kwoniella dejecticola CBS 10117]OBR88864.1 hypothetical protein I303_00681 [Kwoniella dejecticola CBS 10117]